jgi:hypothetical protein
MTKTFDEHKRDLFDALMCCDGIGSFEAGWITGAIEAMIDARMRANRQSAEQLLAEQLEAYLDGALVTIRPRHPPAPGLAIEQAGQLPLPPRRSPPGDAV